MNRSSRVQLANLLLKTMLDHRHLSRNKTLPNFSNSLTLKYYIEMEYLITESLSAIVQKAAGNR
jgi:hypothetical protein